MHPQTSPAAWPRSRWAVLLLVLTGLTFFAQGFHPLAEDGGLYVAGIKWLLHPALFPYGRAFVTEHLRVSLFARIVAESTRLTHIPLLWVLLLADLISIFLTLWAAVAILRRFGVSPWAQLGGTALLAAWWTMPVAGTSLMLMDPYVTGRSFSAPLVLWAVAWAMDDWSRTQPRSLILCVLALIAAAIFHPVMAVYGAGLIITLRLAKLRHPLLAWTSLGIAVLVGSGILQALAPAESPDIIRADYSRYYWFLSQWHWYERLGLIGPLVVLGLLLVGARFRWSEPGRQLLRASIALSIIACLDVLLFAHESYHAFPVARVQPLRVYLMTYAVMAMLLGAFAVDVARTAARNRNSRWPIAIPLALIGASFVGFFAVQRLTFPASPQIEWPGHNNPNPWVQAFVWIKHNTPADAVFALDARYINTDGEDAQVFRAIAERSMLPDYSKDGGEAANSPLSSKSPLAVRWWQGAQAQKDLSKLNDAQRDARILPLGATWMVLHADATTTHTCPYNNGSIKVCRLR